MSEAEGNIYQGEYFEYLHDRGFIRKQLRKFYLRDIRKSCLGKSIDFGCGVGELLHLLEPGSIGFEVNPMAVAYCRSTGLDVQLYDPGQDDYQFRMIAPQTFNTFTMNHVLEHIENSQEVLFKIMVSCHRLGIRRLVFTVPGIKGYASDATHRTFIDRTYFEENGVFENPYYQLRQARYFPVNSPAFGKYFTHNEWRIIFDARHA